MSKLTLSFKGRPLKVYHLDELEEILIGRDPDCAIHIDSLAIAPRQARITRQDDSFSIRALDDAHPVLVNRHQIGETVLQHGDTIDLGKHTLSFAGSMLDLPDQSLARDTPVQDEQPVAAKKSAPLVARLQILEGVDVGRIIILDRSLVRIGRPGGQCAMISRRDSGYYLSHLEGEGPITVDGLPIGDKSHPLADGQTIRVGYTQFQFFLQEAAQTAA